MILDTLHGFGPGANCRQAKYKQSKSEGNSALNNLQKEITTLRDTNRTMQLKLRDIEVANDDFERQARNTTSSLEDMESKYNVAIERGVMLEEEIKTGEQERESLRIENQRLRDELSDLKIEAEIVQDRLRHAESNGVRRRKPAPLYRSPSTSHTLEIFDRSPAGTTSSSPVFATPPAKPSLASTAATPPSPPISESSASLRKSINATPSFPRSRAAGAEPINSRSLYNSRTAPRTSHSRTPSFALSNGRSTPTFNPRSSLSRSSIARPSGLPNSGSLYQIRGLIGKMQKLEERVQSAKSRLPAPSETSSRGSPRAGSRAGSVVGDSPVPSTVTIRRTSRKRISGSSYGSSIRDTESTPSYIPHSRQSFGARTQGDSRPSSRTSFSSRSSFGHSTSGIPSAPPARPESRSSRPGARTPLGHYSTNPTTESRRPRSSLSNHAALGGMTHIEEDNDISTPTSHPPQETRRPSIPATPKGLKKRTTSGASGIPTPRSFKTSIGPGAMPPPKAKTQVEELGETY